MTERFWQALDTRLHKAGITWTRACSRACGRSGGASLVATIHLGMQSQLAQTEQFLADIRALKRDLP